MRDISRRNLLKVAGVAALAGAATPSDVFAGLLDSLFSPPPAKLTAAITPNDEFYVTSYRSPPTVRVDQWELTVKGLVERPLILTYPELLARPTISEIVTLECVGNTVGGDSISTAVWDGVPLKSLLEEAGAAPSAIDVAFHAADGYSDSIPLARASAGDVLVAYKMNGVPLPQGHGFPARIIVPGVYGMKSVQWLTEIEIVDRDYLGYYQKKGWSDEATVKTMSRIDLPGHGTTVQGRRQLVQGLAFAGIRGIQRVEISVNGGTIWNQAQLQFPLSSSAWVFWTYEWNVSQAGRYALLVRATDGTGKAQTSIEQEPAPDGASGLHEITVTVEA